MDAVITGTEDRNFDGGCHCGAIRFRVKGPLRQILMCYCSNCLKMSGPSWGKCGDVGSPDLSGNGAAVLVPQLVLGRTRVLRGLRGADVLQA